MQDDNTPWWILAVLACVVAAGAWYEWSNRPPEPVVDAPAPAAESAEPAAATGPAYPLPAEETPPPGRGELRPLPELSDSDQYFFMELENLFGESSAGRLIRSNLIERLVAAIDNLPRQKIAERIRPAHAPDTAFIATPKPDDNGGSFMGEANFRRYDALVAAFMAADPEREVEVYRRYYPLFQKAYESLGYPEGYFNDRLVEVIDHLLAMPDIDGPIGLTRPNVLYEYADADLQEMSAGRKLLLRVGPKNRALIEKRLTELRALVADH